MYSYTTFYLFIIHLSVDSDVMNMGRNSFENIFVNIDLLVYMMVVGLVSGGALSARIAWPFIFPPVMLEGFIAHHSCLLLFW